MARSRTVPPLTPVARILPASANTSSREAHSTQPKGGCRPMKPSAMCATKCITLTGTGRFICNAMKYSQESRRMREREFVDAVGAIRTIVQLWLPPYWPSGCLSSTKCIPSKASDYSLMNNRDRFAEHARMVALIESHLERASGQEPDLITTRSPTQLAVRY